MPGHDGIYGYWFKEFTSMQRQTGYRNEPMLTRNRNNGMDDWRKDQIDPKRPTDMIPPTTTHP